MGYDAAIETVARTAHPHFWKMLQQPGGEDVWLKDWNKALAEAAENIEAFASGLPGGLPALKALADGTMVLVPILRSAPWPERVKQLQAEIGIRQDEIWRLLGDQRIGVSVTAAPMFPAPPAPEAT